MYACLPALLASLLAVLPLTVSSAQTVPDGFAVEVVHPSPGDQALGFAFLPDERILVIGHHSGQVRLLVDGEMKEEPIGTITELNLERNADPGNAAERGLLGIAVDPDWPDEPFVYVDYTHESGHIHISKFRVDGALDDPGSDDLAIDLSSEDVLLALKDDSEYHNAGTVRFGSDKTLYVSHGDDEHWKEEREPYLQDLTNPYGKILRINRDGTAAEDNPAFPEAPGGRLPEIFAVGLRNPFRFAIDPHTDRLFIGDVGTNIREEFNLSEGGENFGYPRHEGTSFFQENYALVAPEPTPPIHDYAYGKPSSRSAIALATYRPVNFPHDRSFPDAFDGVHFHADHFGGSLRYLRPDGLGGWESEPFGTGFTKLTDASIGPDGSLYLMSYGGPLRKIVYDPTSVSAETPPVAAELELRQNHPNPFSGSTTITYRLGAPVHVSLKVYDVLGREVAAPVDARQAAGVHAARLDGGGLAPGTYVCRLRASGAAATMTMVRVGR